MLIDFFNLIQLYETNLTKIRIGHIHDGGYILLDELNKNTEVVYSFGVADDATFESVMYENYKTPKIRMYDPFVEEIPKFGWRAAYPTLKAEFYKLGLGKIKILHFNTLESFINENNDFNKNLLLKIDIENAEWESLLVTPSEVLKNFNQIIIEFHELNRISKECSKCIQNINYCSPLNTEELKVRYDVMKKLTDDFYIFHAHANNGFPLQVLESIKVPPILELSFVRKDLVTVSKINWEYSALDSPNNHNLSEIHLNFWPFRR